MTATASETELAHCPGCGGEAWTKVREAGNPTLDPSERFTIVRCNACGMHWTNPRPTLGTLGRYYPSDYSPYQNEEGAAGGDAGSLKNIVLRSAYGSPALKPGLGPRVLAGAIGMVRSPESFGFGVEWRGRGRLLDFGCGSGKFLRRMHAMGWDVTGIDFSAEAVKRVVDSGLRALQGTLPHPELKAGSFDVVAMRHALEHVPEPREILRCAWELLDACGLLLIAVPNYEAWEIEKLGEAAMGIDVPRHLNHFTPATLEAMMRREGMTDIRVRQKSRASWIRKAAKRAKGSGGTLGNILKMSAASRVAAMIAQARGRGNEIIATAGKR